MAGCINNEVSDNLSWEFDIGNNNTAKMVVTDPLLDTKERAEERAMAEFLKNSFAINSISFTTSRDDLILNQTIKVGGLNYIIKSIGNAVDDVQIGISVNCERYD